MVVTSCDRDCYKNYTDATIIGYKRISMIPSKCLRELLTDKIRFEKLRIKIGKDTNPGWVYARIAEMLYNRDEMTHDELRLY